MDKIFLNNKFYFTFILFLNISIIYKVKTQLNNSTNYILIPFKSYFPNIDSSNAISALIDSWTRRKLFLDIEDESGKKLPFILNSEEPLIYTSENLWLIKTDEQYFKPYSNANDICNFNYQNSNSYKYTTEFNKSFHYMTNICYAKERIYLYDDFDLKKKKLYDLEFIHSSNETHICFFAGLQLTEAIYEKKLSLLYQLKNLIDSNSYSWVLKFTSPEEGFLIFGDIVNNNKLKFYNDNIEENYITQTVFATFSSVIYWKFYLEKIFFGEYTIKSDNLYFFINFQSRYITIPRVYFDDIKNIYMLSNEKLDEDICFEEFAEYFFKTIYCNKKKYLQLTDNYKKLPKFILYGYQLEGNLTFEAKDLFLEKDDKVYFFIAYNSHKNDEWNMGSIFFEKFITVFNNELKTIKILKKGDQNDNNRNNPKKKENTKIILIIVLAFILSALIFSFVGIFFGKKIYQLRKKKANELNDDDYDYSPQSINVEEQKE